MLPLSSHLRWFLFVVLVLVPLPWQGRAGAQASSGSTASRVLEASACGSGGGAPGWCRGSELGAWVNAADHELGAGLGTITIAAPGTATTAINLTAGHDLQIDAPVTFQLSATLAGKQTVSCSGPLAAISGPAIAVFLAADGADRITVRDCTFTNTSSTMLYTHTYATNLAMLHNTGGCILSQDRFGKLPGSNYLVEGNTAEHCPAPAAVYIVQAWNDVRVLGNHFAHETSGAEWFGPDASTYPSYATISQGGGKNAIFAQNTCEDMAGTCAWGSGMWRTIMEGNSADGCGDICFDLEGSADSLIEGNTCRNSGSCACPAFFTGFYNSVIGNDFVQANGNAIIALKNNNHDAANIQGITIRNNTFSCPAILCAVVHAETTSGLIFAGNHVLNGRFDNVGVAVQGVIQDNVFDYSVQALPGAGNNVNAGLNIPSQYHSYVTAKNNVINTLVPQAAGTYCINAAELDPTGGNTFYIEGNQCTGPWPRGIFVAGASSTYYLHDNFLPELPVAGTSAVYQFGNSTPSGTHN